MRTRILLTTALLLTFAQAIHSQTADSWVSQGRAYLAATNLAAANNCFYRAVAASASHQTGNAFYAVTRLLVWPSQPAGSNFLSRLNVPIAGRDIYNWKALPPTDRTGVPPPPWGLSAGEFTAMLRTNILAELIGAEANLAKVTDTNFVLNLTSNETRTVAVTLDYGDIQLLRAMLQAAEYSAYTTYSWNLDVMLDPVYDLYNVNQFSLEGFLSDHPGLLTFATTNELAAAKAALLAGVSRYCQASQLITNRATNIVRLFNYDADEADDEANFRQTLIDLTNSLTHAVTLGVDTNYTVFLGSQFSGTHAPRSFLPMIRGNGFGLGTLPDPTFGGLISNAIPGVVEDSVEEFFARSLTPIPTIAPGLTRAGPQFQFPINTLKNRGYTVEVSTNFHDWTTCGAFFSFADSYAFADSSAYGSQRRFYRVVDRTKDMPLPPNSNFADRIPLTGPVVVTYGYNANDTPEHGEPGYRWNSVWWSWTAPVSGTVAVAAFGGTGWPYARVYTGTVLTNLSLVAHDSQPFYAMAGTTYQIQVYGEPGGIRLVITAPPALTVSTPTNGTAFPAPTNITISASASDSDGSVSNLTFYTDGVLFGSKANTSLSMIWSNVGAGVHWVDVQATDNLGMTTWSNLTVYVRPPNDNFANRIPITSVPATVYGSNYGATKEPGEPNHAGDPGGASVWWSWTAPFSGSITISVSPIVGDWINPGPPCCSGGPEVALGVYTGSSVSNLIPVASSESALAQVCFVATAGTTYQIAVDGAGGASGAGILRLIPTQPPSVSISSPTNGEVINVPYLSIVADSVDTDGSVSRVDFYDNSNYCGSVSNAPYSLELSNLYSGTTHSLVAKATDNMGATAYSAPVSVSIDYPDWQLFLNIPKPSLCGCRGDEYYYWLEVPPGLSQLTIQTYGGWGDCDLYVAYGYEPTLDEYDYRPYVTGNNEQVVIDNPPEGEWYIMLNGYDYYCGVTLSAHQ
jgi:hypothetical protein